MLMAYGYSYVPFTQPNTVFAISHSNRGKPHLGLQSKLFLHGKEGWGGGITELDPLDY